MKFDLANKYNLDEINNSLDKFTNTQINNEIITSYDNRELCCVYVSKKYYNFDFSSFCKKIVSEIGNYFTPEAYLLRIRSGVQELRLVGDKVLINGESYLKMVGITNSTNKQVALSMNIGLVRESNVTGSVHISFKNKHFVKSMPNKLKTFSDNLINFNMDIEYHIKTIKDLSEKEISFKELVEKISTKNDGTRIKTMILKVRALGKKLEEYGYTQVNTLRNPFSGTVKDFKVNSKDVFDAYTELFKNYDTSVMGRETRRVLNALKK